MTRHEQTRTLFFSDGAKVYLKQDDGQDCPFDLSVTQGVPGLIQIEALHAVGRWLLASYTSPLPAGQFPHPTAVPVGLVTAWDLSSPPPFTSYLLQPSSTEIAAHKLAAPAIESVMIQNNPEPFIFTGSMDGTVKMWQFVASSGAFNCVAFDSAHAHVRGVRSLVFCNGYLFSASGDRTIKVWSPDTRTCVATIMPPAQPRGPRSLLAGVGSNGIDQDAIAIDTFNYQNIPFVVAAYKDGSLRCFDVSNPVSPKVIEDPTGRVDGGTNNESGAQQVELTSMVHMSLDASNPVEPAILLGYSVSFLLSRPTASL
jgi:WD40 repeat protein